MANALKRMEDEALKLPARSRARLAERLIASLEKITDPAESDWLVEVERRSSELVQRKVKGVPANKVLKKARSALR